MQLIRSLKADSRTLLKCLRHDGMLKVPLSPSLPISGCSDLDAFQTVRKSIYRTHFIPWPLSPRIPFPLFPHTPGTSMLRSHHCTNTLDFCPILV